MTRKLGLLASLLLALAGGAVAQRLQNMDMFIFAAVNRVPARTVEGIAVPDTIGWSLAPIYGYQIMRESAASIWLDIPIVGSGTGHVNAGGGTIGTQFWAYTPGLRLSLPVHERVSVHGLAGGGAGSFYGRPYFTGGANPILTNHITWHGVFELGGGVDVRLSRRWSVRGEVRDFITGRGLGGVDGRHHRMQLFGVGLHF